MGALAMIDWKLKAALVPGAILGALLTITPLMPALMVLMGIDFATGFLVAWGLGQVSSEMSRRGFTKKAVTLLLIVASWVLQGLHPLGFDLAGVLAGVFGVTEFISIAENVGRSGVPLPRALTGALAKLREQMQQSKDQ